MAGFNLGAFAGGIGQGMEQGQNIREKYRKMAEEQVARRAQQAVENYLTGGPANPAPGGGAPPVAPGAPPPGQPPMQAALPGAQPMPGAGGPPPPGGMPGAPPGPGAAPPPMAAPGGAGPPGANAPAPPPGAAPMAPPPQPGPQGPPAGGAAPAPPGGGAGGLPPPGSPQAQDPIIQSKVALQSLAKEIAAANPGRKWQHGELLDAVNDALDGMDRINPIAKQIAQLQLQYYKAQLTSSDKGADRESREDIAGAKLHEQATALVERVRHDKASEQTASGRVATYAEMATYNHEDRQAAIAAANERASQAVDSRERVAAQKDADTMARLDKALEDKDWATVAQIQSGEYKADVGANATGKPTPKPAVAPPPKRGGGGAAPAQGSAPPVAGARKAPDGKWYVSDPKRPGKYLMVQ